MSQESRLVVLVDGRPLPDDEARAMWVRFSAWMDEHRGDFDGFAKSEGFVSARPETRGGKAVLVLSTKAGKPGGGAARKPPDGAGRAHGRATKNAPGPAKNTKKQTRK